MTKLTVVFFTQSKLDRFNSSFRTEIIHTGLQAFLPSIEVHARKFSHRCILNKEIQALTLANECSPVRCHIDDRFLADLPYGFVTFFQFLWKTFNMLNTTI